jgi:hypothetical protein
MEMMRRFVQLVLRAFAGVALLSGAVLWAGSRPAVAAPCTPIVLLQILCPKTTAPPTTAAATSAPPTTKALVTGHPTSPATSSAKKSVASKTSARAVSVGDPGLPASVPGVVTPSLSSGADAVAPQLAGTAAPTTSSAVADAPVAQSRLSVVGEVGLPNDHATLRIVLSLLTALVAGVALAQLPASRRRPRADGDPPR